MKKVLLIALTAILVVSSAAMATDTRTASIGSASAFLTDYTDIYFLPSTLIGYPRWISAELGTFPASYAYYGSASVTFTNNEEQTWGVIGLDINHDIDGEQLFSEDLAYIGGSGLVPLVTPNIPLPTDKFHLFYAKKVANLTAGIHIARAAGSSTGEFSDSSGYNRSTEFSSGIWNINAGVSLAPMPDVNVDAAFAFQTLSFAGERSYTQPLPAPGTSGTRKIEADGGSNIMFGARAFYGMSDALKIVPAIDVNMYSLSYKTSFANSDTMVGTASGGKKSISDIKAAFGLNYVPVENVTLVGGLHIGFKSTTIEDTMGVFSGTANETKRTISENILPEFSAAVEARLLKWMVLRFGASKMLTSSTTEAQQKPSVMNETKTKNTTTTAPYAFNFGLGLTFGKLCIDAKVNDDQPFSLGYLMSGNNVERAPFTQVSATYKF
ncbi:MAG: hypothetical protein QME74_06535 [Candidatus Edwardsbacteria bacterium]|nr:hypothetical protein [Candidatus Edwardsbacteria bacterium]